MSLACVIKQCSDVESSRFMLALAVCAPITTFAAGDAVSVQVTDRSEDRGLGDYAAFQALSGSLAILVASGVALVSRRDCELASVVVVLSMAQVFGSIRSACLAVHQRRERLDVGAVSNSLLGVVTLLGLWLVCLVHPSAMSAALVIMGFRALFVVVWDAPLAIRGALGARSQSLFRFRAAHLMWIWKVNLPLGCVGLLISVFLNMPTYSLTASGKDGEVVPLAAVLSLVSAGMLVTNAMTTAALPRLRAMYEREPSRLLGMMRRLMLFGALLGVVGLVLSMAIGGIVLQFMFNEGVAQRTDLLMAASVFGGLAYSVTFVGSGLSALQRFAQQPLAHLCAVVVAAVCCALLVPRHGAMGAVLALCLGKVAQGGVAWWIFVKAFRERCLDANGPASA